MMSYLITQPDADQMTIKFAILLIVFFLVIIIAIIFYVFAADKIEYMMQKEKDNDKCSRPSKSRYDGLNENQINLYFALSQRQLNDVFLQRDNENKTILSHVAIIVAIGSLFIVLIKWTHHFCTDMFSLLFIMVFFITAFCSFFLSIWSMYLSLSLMYEMPVQLDDLNPKVFSRSESSFKSYFAEYMTRAAKKNSENNIRKMFLLERSRYFQKVTLVFLAIILVFLCGQELLSTFLKQ